MSRAKEVKVYELRHTVVYAAEDKSGEGGNKQG